MRDIKLNLPMFILVLVLVVAVVISGPLLVIWALNTIFILAIPYNLSTWFAMLVLGIVVNGGIRGK